MYTIRHRSREVEVIHIAVRRNQRVARVTMLVLYRIRDSQPKPVHRKRHIVRHQQMVLVQRQRSAVVIPHLPAINEYHHHQRKLRMNYGIY